MARFSETAVLRNVTTSIGDDGRGVESVEDSEVFFNRFSLSLQSRLAGGSDGLLGVVEGRVRSVDYSGQQVVVLGGKEYTVADASDSGEFTRMTLTERLSDG